MTARRGTILLVRHGEPALSRRVRLSAREYRQWWDLYEIGGIRTGQVPPQGLAAEARTIPNVVSSTRRRAIETTQALIGERDFIQDGGLIEAPLPPPPFPGVIRLSPKTWGFIARVWWWFFNHHDIGAENRAEAEARAEAMSARLIAMTDRGGDVLVVAHGFFNFMIGRVLIRRGWRRVEDQGFRYWSIKRFDAPDH